MTAPYVGLWLVGAYGGVGTTITLGLSALARGLQPTTGLVTALPAFRGLDLPAPADFVIGGHDIREGSFVASAEEFRRNSGVFEPELIAACRDDLEAASARVQVGTKVGSNDAIARLGNWGDPRPARTPREAVDRIATEYAAFVQAEKVDHLIVLNVASTEPPFPPERAPNDGADPEVLLERGGADGLPSSALYALAAVRNGHSYINFTPSLGASLPAFHAMAERTGSVLAGKDGKTGETLMKTVLAPMFATRNLEVMSWVGHNIFGNRDGVVLDDPANKASKVETKDRVVTQILGYKPSTLVTIEYIQDMGDWKTAWDHIHFRGFLGAKMALQFTWQGCDSLLAAPLAIDLARLVAFERGRGGKGLQRHLAPFFKSPEGVAENDYFKQLVGLHDYAAAARSSQSTGRS